LELEVIDLDIQQMLSDLRQERERIDKAIKALEEALGDDASMLPSPARKRRHNMTPEGRRKLSELMKQRWAARKNTPFVRSAG
jgi:hypothetical protein